MRLEVGESAPGARRTGRARRRTAAGAALLLAAALAVGGCSASSKSSDKAAGPAVDNARSAPSAGSGGGADAAGGSGTASGSGTGASSSGRSGAKTPPLAATYLVRTASLSVRTPHVADALARARALAAAAGGYSGDENTFVDGAGHTTSSVQLRVPPAAYDSVLGDLSALGTLLSRKVSVQDVTGQVVDVQSRVRSQQASVDRVRKLMDQAANLGDVVSLESELSTREAALESLEAQQASLKEQTNLATISLSLSEPPVKQAAAEKPKVTHDGFWTQVGHALGGGWHAFYVALRTVLVVLSVLLPFLAAGLLLLVVYRVVRRRWWPLLPGPDRPAGRLRAPDGLPRYPQDDAADPGEVPGDDDAVPAAPPLPGRSPRAEAPREQGPHAG